MPPLRAHVALSPPTLVRRHEPAAVVALATSVAAIGWRGEVDMATAPACRRAARDAIGADVASVVLDLRHVAFVDAAGLSVVALLVRGCRARNQTLLLVDPTPAVRATLHRSGLAGVTRVVPAQSLAEPTQRLLAECA